MTAHLFIKTPVTDPERYQEYVRARPSCVAPSSALPSARPGRSPACGEEAVPDATREAARGFDSACAPRGQAEALRPGLAPRLPARFAGGCEVVWSVALPRP